MVEVLVGKNADFFKKMKFQFQISPYEM